MKSGYKGVSYDESHSMWRAVGHSPWRHIGYYNNEMQAAHAYDLDLKTSGIKDINEYNFPEKYVMPRTVLVYLVMPDNKVYLVWCPDLLSDKLYEFARKEVGVTDPSIITPWSRVNFTNGIASLSWFVKS